MSHTLTRHTAGTGLLCGSLLVLFSPPALASVINAIDLDVMGKGESVGKITMKVSTLGLGGGLVGNQSLVGKFTATKKNADGTTMTIDELEQFLGQDHLNWFQKVTSDTNPPKNSAGTTLTPPYIDPPKGGYSDLAADDAPWYWNENATAPAGTKLSEQTMGSMVQFEDAPSVVGPSGPIKGAKVDFALFLISDFGHQTYEVLGKGISWGIVMEEVPGFGVFPHIKCLESGASFTDEYAKEITDEFGYTPVPEPASLLLLGVGLLGLIGWRRRVPR